MYEFFKIDRCEYLKHIPGKGLVLMYDLKNTPELKYVRSGDIVVYAGSVYRVVSMDGAVVKKNSGLIVDLLEEWPLTVGGRVYTVACEAYEGNSVTRVDSLKTEVFDEEGDSVLVIRGWVPHDLMLAQIINAKGKAFDQGVKAGEEGLRRSLQALLKIE